MKQNEMQHLMRQAQEMQKQLEAAQRDLAERTYEGTAGGGVVKATVTGSGDLTELTLDPAVVDPDDTEMLSDLVVAAVNQATAAAQDDAQAQLGGLTGGIDLGGMQG